MATSTTSSDPLERFRKFETISPFELKDDLIKLAKDPASTHVFLDAGRGNPNWIATTPRESYFLFGRFGIEESKRVWDEPDLGGMPKRDGIGARFDEFIKRNASEPGGALLKTMIEYGVEQLGFDKDAWLFELTDAIIGDMYPVPMRMGRHMEQVASKYLVREMCGDSPPPGTYDVFAVEGGTAAMCYIFDSLTVNGLLKRGDRIALAVPTFTPYLEIAHLDRYAFETVEIDASGVYDSGAHSWQYPDSEIDKLLDPTIKAFFVVNPSNPPSYAIARPTLERIAKISTPQELVAEADLILCLNRKIAFASPSGERTTAFPIGSILWHSANEAFEGWSTHITTGLACCSRPCAALKRLCSTMECFLSKIRANPPIPDGRKRVEYFRVWRVIEQDGTASARNFRNPIRAVYPYVTDVDIAEAAGADDSSDGHVPG